MSERLTDLQRRVLAILAPVRPPWTLTGGGALAGFHLRHRTTRDLDLFWHGRAGFEREPDDCARRLLAAGLQVDTLQRSPAFVRLLVKDAQDTVLVDLVAEPVRNAMPPVCSDTPGGPIQVDSAQEILANKLGCLLHRAELRDLVDLQALLEAGLDLRRGLHDAGAKDLGFSPLMVGHLLATFPVARLGKALGLDATTTDRLDAFRADLAARIAAASRP